MPNIGPLEIAIVLIIALLVFGPKRLPDLGRSLGRGINEFREGLSSIGDPEPEDEEDDLDTEATDEEDTVAELGPGEAPADYSAAAEPEVTEVTPASREAGQGEGDAADSADGEAASEPKN